MLLLKYDRAGQLQWARRREGVASVPPALASDSAGNVYAAVGVYADTPRFDLDVLVLKYSPAGDLLWTRRWDGGNELDDASADLAADPNGNVVVGGWSSTSTSSLDDDTALTVSRWDTAGYLQWSRALSGPIWSDFNADAVAVNGAGEIYVAGDSVLAKYATNGTLLWSRVTSEINSLGQAHLALGSDGRACVAGAGEIGREPYVTACYGASGQLLWKQTWFGASGKPSSIAVDAMGAVVVTGVAGDWFKPRLATLRYDATGALLWERVDLETGSYDHGVPGLALGDAGQAYISWHSATNEKVDYRLTVYDFWGYDLWSETYRAPSEGPSAAAGVVVDADGRVFVTGHSWGGAETGMDVVTLAYDAVPPRSLAFYTVSPCRLIDTRATSPLRAGKTDVFAVAGICGVPSSAVSVSANVTVTQASDSGHLQVWPAGQPPPPTSVVNHSASQTRANSAVLRLGSDGRLALRLVQPNGSGHVLVDVTGYFE
jgi:hypothetical protein